MHFQANNNSVLGATPEPNVGPGPGTTPAPVAGPGPGTPPALGATSAPSAGQIPNVGANLEPAATSAPDVAPAPDVGLSSGAAAEPVTGPEPSATPEPGTLAKAEAELADSKTTRRWGISSFTLKMLAIVAMTCNHAGYIFYPHLPFEVRCGLLAVGGLTFPIMAFLLVEGYVHTSNLKRYAGRLAVFALVSQVPFWLFLGHEGNVLFTLLGGLVVLWAVDNISDGVARAGAVLAITLITWVCDWGAVGPVLVLLFYTLRQRRGGVALAMLFCIGIGLYSTLGHFFTALQQGSWRNLPFVLYFGAGNTAAIPLLMSYNGKRGWPLKWFFYVYYPAHIAVLGIVHVLVFGSMPAIMIG